MHYNCSGIFRGSFFIFSSSLRTGDYFRLCGLVSIPVIAGLTRNPLFRFNFYLCTFI